MTNLEKLIADCELYAKTIEGVIVVDDQWKPGDPETREPRETLLHAASALRAFALAAQQDGALTPAELNLVREWYNALCDTSHPKYFEAADHALGKKITDQVIRYEQESSGSDK